MCIVEAQQVRKVYRMGTVEVRALDGLDLSIEAGEFVAVMGPSGSGKSTLLNVLGCMDRPTSGKIFLDGVDLETVKHKDLPRLRREKIGFVFQQYHLLNHLTALENVALPLRYTNTGRKAARERAEALLARVGLAERVHHRPLELSGGQQQRVAVARALVNRPAIVLADEPTGNLDSASGDAIMDLLRQLNAEGQTFIAVTHDPRVAARTDRIIRLRDGRIKNKG